MSKSTTAPVVASTVRDYFRADAKRFARLSPEAQVTVKEGARGRLHAQAVKEFNAKRRTDRRYVTGATKAVTKAKNEQAKALRASLQEKGLAGKRGPLSKAAQASLKG